MTQSNLQNFQNWFKHIFGIIIGIIILLVIIYQVDYQKLKELQHLEWVPLVSAFVVSFFIGCTIAFRWFMITNLLIGRRVGQWHEYLYYYLIGRVMGFILPKDITDIGGRALILSKNHNVSMSLAGSSTIIDRLFDVFSIITFLPPVLIFWLGWINHIFAISLLITVAITTALFILLFQNQIIDKFINITIRFPNIHKQFKELKVNDGINSSMILYIYILSVIKFIFATGRLILIVSALRLPISPFLILFGMPLGQLSFLFAFTPGGIGIFEAGWYGILKLGNVLNEHAVIFVLSQRIFTMIFTGLLTILSHFHYTICTKKIKI